MFVQRTSIVQSFLRRHIETFKAIAVGILRCHVVVNDYGASYSKMVSSVIVQKKLKKKVTHTCTQRKKKRLIIKKEEKLFRQRAHKRSSTDTKKRRRGDGRGREIGRQTDGKREMF